MKGILYGVGVGPGDPRLMTYLAVETIRRCPVIAVPADGKENAVAYRIASGIVKDIDSKECINLTTPMTKDKAVLNAAYQTAADRIIEKLDQGKDVACLTLGDPTIYSIHLYSSYRKNPWICRPDHQRCSIFLCSQCPSGRQSCRPVRAASYHSVHLWC